MSNLLPRVMKRDVRREYHVRVATVAGFVVAVAVGSQSLLLLPSYLLVNSKLHAAEDKLSAQNASMGDAYGQVVSDIERANKIVTELSKTEHGAAVTTVLEAIMEEAGNNVRINGVVIRKPDSETQNVELRGVAATRDELASFVDRLKQNTLITSAEVPFSDLAQARDAGFTASLVIKTTTP